jgi:hypothetical protein
MTPRPPASSFRVRPRFEHPVALAPDQTRARILEAFRHQAPAFEVKDFPGFIGLHIGANERRYWSPRLLIVLEPTKEGTTLVQGIYGPEMEVWSVFLYGYLITGMLGTFSGMLAYAQFTVGSNPWGLWVVAASATIAVLLYLFAQLGQKLGAWQTFQLHHTYQTALGFGERLAGINAFGGENAGDAPRVQPLRVTDDAG